jgi:iron complex transport system ATP-binding protein
MIAARDIHRRAGGLGGISLTLESAAVTAVIGANGAGKSTLLEVLAGRKRSDSGTVTIDGRPLAAWPPEALGRRRAFLPQSCEIAFDIAVEDLVALGRAPYHGEDPALTAKAVAAGLSLAQVAHLGRGTYRRLSGGERQRVQLARAIAQIWRAGADATPRLLILDEPTASLDPGHRLSVMRLLRDLKAEGVGVLLALHDLNDAARFADRILLLHRGRTLGLGTPAEVLTPDLLRTAYAAEVETVAAADGHPVFVFR